MVTSQQVREQVEEYFGDAWVWHVLKSGTWGMIPGMDDYMDIFIDNMEIRIYPLRIDRTKGINLAVWDYTYSNPQNNHDNLHITSSRDFGRIPRLLDRFFALSPLD